MPCHTIIILLDIPSPILFLILLRPMSHAQLVGQNSNKNVHKKEEKTGTCSHIGASFKSARMFKEKRKRASVKKKRKTPHLSVRF
ncbi:MAG: hypothetical protein J3R72DRAFT_438153 [Linnemannia gamsii]|nr:MAG: hypothetical protein J3R72DRAFT_438153 [Linnemannia gamsii]